MASNGITDLGQFDFMNRGMYPGSQLDRSYYASDIQTPLAAQAAQADYDPAVNPLTGEPVSRFAQGGIATLHYDGEDGSLVTEPEDPFLGNKDFQNLSFSQMQDADRLKELNALKETNPDQYKSQLMRMLGESLKEQYNINADYEPTWKQFQSLQESNPEQWHKQQLDWLGHQQGWQVGQNTSERNAVGLPAIQNQIEQAKKAGISQEEIDSILSGSSQKANYENQQRIINQQQAGNGPFGMTTKDYLTVASILGSGAAAAYFAPAMAATGAAGTATPLTTAELLAGAGGSFVPSAGSGASFVLPAGATVSGGTGALTTAEILGSSGFTPTAGSSFAIAPEAAYTAASGSAASQFSPEIIAQANASKDPIGYLASLEGATPAEMALYTTPVEGAAGIDKLAAAQKVAKMNAAMKLMGSGNSQISGQGTSGQGVASYSPPPTQQYIAPTMLGQQKYGELYRPYTYDYTRRAAEGGMMYGNGGGISTLGSYSDGGRLLKGPGDGMSDDIPASIGESQPAALADGEFVIPADVVSHLGNGSTEAGAKQLYKMMDKIRHARTGNKKQGKQINPDKFLPKE